MTITTARNRLLLAPAVLVSLAAATYGLATSGPVHADAPATTTLSFDAKPIAGGGVDNAPKGPSRGDGFYETDRITAADGKPAGTAAVTGELVGGTPAHGQEQTTVTVSLAGGQLVAIGSHPTVDRFTIPIVGGTGPYLAAAGALTLAPAKHGAEHVMLTLVTR